MLFSRKFLYAKNLRKTPKNSSFGQDILLQKRAVYNDVKFQKRIKKTLQTMAIRAIAQLKTT